MRFDKLTQKAQEAVLEAQSLAERYQHPAVEPEHLLEALVTQEGGVAPSIMKRIGVDVAMLRQGIEQALNKMARATGTAVQIGMSRALADTIREAEDIASNMKDEYTSTEHLLLAMTAVGTASPKAGKVRELLARYGIDYNTVLQASRRLRWRTWR
jgi:ATP-dependent Clp protease ATP-binding subunit ClpB